MITLSPDISVFSRCCNAKAGKNSVIFTPSEDNVITKAKKKNDSRSASFFLRRVAIMYGIRGTILSQM